MITGLNHCWLWTEAINGDQFVTTTVYVPDHANVIATATLTGFSGSGHARAFVAGYQYYVEGVLETGGEWKEFDFNSLMDLNDAHSVTFEVAVSAPNGAYIRGDAIGIVYISDAQVF